MSVISPNDTPPEADSGQVTLAFAYVAVGMALALGFLTISELTGSGGLLARHFTLEAAVDRSRYGTCSRSR
ncbi:MAG: hypothetical protein ACHQK9_09410 [Reyranellales bacterium]